MKKIISFVLAGILVTPVLANDLTIKPIVVGSEIVRYQKGVPTVDLETVAGGVQVSPLPMDHGSLSFSVVVFNGSDRPANIDITDIAVKLPDGSTVICFTKDELVKHAANRAAWAQIGVALAAGLSAANNTTTIHTTTYTPHGLYSSHTTIDDPYASQAAIAQGSAMSAAIQARLDDQRAQLGDEIVQMSTVDPQQTYGGRIVLQKLKSKQLPAQIILEVNWNGVPYPFTFSLSK